MARAALRIQDKIEKGWRKEAKKLGQLWDIERNGAVVLQDYTGIIERYESTKLIEIDTVSLTYKLRGPRRLLQIGDFLLGKEIASKRQMTAVGERYLLATMRLHRDNILVRADKNITIYRPQHVQLAGNNPPVYSIPNPILASADQILARNTTTNVWSFRDPTSLVGYSTLIWAGITFGRAGEYPNNLRVPLTTPDEGWSITTSLFNGVTLVEGDFVVDADNSWYRIDRAYAQTNSGFVHQLRCTKMKM